MLTTKQETINQLKKNILLWQGFKAPAIGTSSLVGLGCIESAFPNSIFPVGVIHEFLSLEPEQAAACSGFISGLLKALMKQGGICLWISRARKVFPPALKAFGVNPERIIFIDLQHEKDVLWVTEEALKCEGIAAVVAETREISFAESQRLQLVVERSKVTGFILRNDPLKLGTTACVARWKITPLPSSLADGMPGVGFPRWQVELLKVRNGTPGAWQVEWIAGSFAPVAQDILQTVLAKETRKAG